MQVLRIDLFLVEKGYFASRAKAQSAIEKGTVKVNGKQILSNSFCVKENDEVDVEKNIAYASNGAHKLIEAFNKFNFCVNSCVAIDVGASNGGFTHVLLEKGANKVFAIDVGETQLEDFLKIDSRVVILDNTNARELKKSMFLDDVDCAVMDISFISQKYVLKAVCDVLKDGGEMVSLIKPQFEVGKTFIGKNGIVKDKKAIANAVFEVCMAATEAGFFVLDICVSPIRPKKNIEFFGHFKKNANNNFGKKDIGLSLIDIKNKIREILK